MRHRIITVTTAFGLAAASLVYLQAKEPEQAGPKHEHGAGPHHMMMGNPLEHLSKDLNLTDDQKTKVQPIIDQAKPQMKAIHEEAMQKMHALMESTGAQIRPLLTPEQQVKFDAIKKAHEDMKKAHEEMENAQKM
jgi:Spy/CpxP family protein refolding chaperone